MTAFLALRSGTSGPEFVGVNQNDAVLWDTTARKWYVGPVPGGGGAVSSVFSRAGAVVAQSGDYDTDQVDNLSSVPGASASDALDSLDSGVTAAQTTATAAQGTANTALANAATAQTTATAAQGTANTALANAATAQATANTVNTRIPVGTVDGQTPQWTGAAYAAKSNPYYPVQALGNSGAAISIDTTLSTVASLTLNANCSVTLTGLVANKAQWFQIEATQDGTGNRTLAIVGARTPGGFGLTMSTAAGALDVVSCYWNGTVLFAQVAGLAFS